MKTTVLGMGRMGRALASRLLATGHDVTVWNRSPGQSGELLKRGASERDTVKEAANGADVTFAVLSDDEASMQVLAPDGKPAVLPGKSVVINAATTSPATARRLTEIYGSSFLAAPILGSPDALASGSAAMVLGGPEKTIGQLEPLFKQISSGMFRAGADPGRALIVKLISNYWLLAGIVTLSEGIALGEAAGFSEDDLIDLATRLPTVAPALHNRVADVVSGDHSGWFSSVLGAKDVHLFDSAAAADGVDTPLARAVHERYKAAVNAGIGDLDIGAVVELLRRR